MKLVQFVLHLLVMESCLLIYKFYCLSSLVFDKPNKGAGRKYASFNHGAREDRIGKGRDNGLSNLTALLDALVASQYPVMSVLKKCNRELMPPDCSELARNGAAGHNF